MSASVRSLPVGRVAVTLFTLRDFTQTPAAIGQTLHRVKAIGYDNVQLSALGPIEPKELKALLDDAGLFVCATHVSLERLQNDLDAVIAEHHLWGCPHVAIGALPAEWRNAEGYRRFAREGSQIGRRLAEAGLTFSYHNHWWELERHDGRSGLEIILEESDPRFLGAEIDTAWIQRGGDDPAAWIKKLAGRQPLVHFKDMIIQDSRPLTVEIGEVPESDGQLDWLSILPACREARVGWHIVEQDYCQRDPFESIAISLRNLRALGLNGGGMVSVGSEDRR